jgi:hypothetical protein
MYHNTIPMDDNYGMSKFDFYEVFKNPSKSEVNNTDNFPSIKKHSDNEPKGTLFVNGGKKDELYMWDAMTDFHEVMFRKSSFHRKGPMVFMYVNIFTNTVDVVQALGTWRTYPPSRSDVTNALKASVPLNNLLGSGFKIILRIS